MLGCDARLNWNDPGINVIHIGCSTVGEQLTNTEANICLGALSCFLCNQCSCASSTVADDHKQFLSLPTLRISPLPE